MLSADRVTQDRSLPAREIPTGWPVWFGLPCIVQTAPSFVGSLSIQIHVRQATCQRADRSRNDRVDSWLFQPVKCQSLLS